MDIKINNIKININRKFFLFKSVKNNNPKGSNREINEPIISSVPNKPVKRILSGTSPPRDQPKIFFDRKNCI